MKVKFLADRAQTRYGCQMKVVLLKDVRGIGRAHAVVNVSDGHALNHLIPSKLAVLATGTAVKTATSHMEKIDSEKQMQATLIRETIANLAEGVLTIAKKVNEQGHLYDAVDARDIAVAAKLPEGSISLEKPIKELGRITVPVQYGEDFGSIEVEVVAE